MNFKTMDIEDIINWCKENNEVAWLKAKAKEKVEVKVYPRKKVIKTKEDGTTYKTTEADKSKPYKIEKRDITFIQIKRDFCEKFMPELIPVAKEDKKPTMYDIIAAL